MVLKMKNKKPNRIVKFNKDGTVTEISPQGTEATGTRKDYKAGAGAFSNVQRESKEARMAFNQTEQAARQARVQKLQNELIGGEQDIKQTQQNTQIPQTQGEMQQEQTLQSFNAEAPAERDRLALFNTGTFNFSPEQIKKEMEMQKTNPEAYAQMIAARKRSAVGIPLGLVAQAADSLGSIVGISLKKSVKAQATEAAFNDLNTGMSELISSYQNGLIDYEMVESQLLAMRNNILELERQSKREGMVNLRYWLTNGREIEAQVFAEKNKFDGWLRQLQQIQMQQQQTQQQQAALLNFGT